MKWRRQAAALVIGVVVVAGCSPSEPAASGTGPLASATTGGAGDQLARGTELYAAHCASCHGAEGEGDVGPAVIGERYSFRSRATAQGLYDYVSVAMPFDDPGGLSDQEYWDILAWILDENELLPAGTELGVENASDISVNP